MLHLRPAAGWEAAYVGAHLRPEDQREAETATRMSGQSATELSFWLSRRALSMYGRASDALPLGIIGVADDPRTSDYGIVWLLATASISKVWFSLYHRAPAIADDLGTGYKLGLHNAVDARNTLHLRWLDRCGFVRMDSADINGHQFIHVVRLNHTQINGAP